MAFFSHSSARAVCDVPRNAPDDVLETLSANDGVCMVTFVPAFVSPAWARWYSQSREIVSERGGDPRRFEDLNPVMLERAQTDPPPLVTVERPAAGDPDGLLVLHHGRGTDENDLLGLADALDPERRLRVVSARGPLTVPGWPGFHWYVVPRVGYPDRASFDAAREALAELHDGLWEEFGIGPERTVLGGFSMGAVMSHAMAWSEDRPAVAGVLAFSGFVPNFSAMCA